MDRIGIVRPTPPHGGIVKIDDQTITTTTEEIIEEEESEEEHPKRKPSSEAVIKLIEKIDIERIDITDLIVVIALSIALVYSIHMKMMELAMSIGSGLLGYIGGVTKREDQMKAARRMDKTKTITTSRPDSSGEKTKDSSSSSDTCQTQTQVQTQENQEPQKIRELKDPNDAVN